MRPWLFALFGASALASPAPNGLGSGTTDKFEVLDVSISKGWAAIKVVDHDEPIMDYAAGSANCHYAGMSAQPTSGVTLALWDLGAGRLADTWVVYGKVADESECTPAETSTKNLADAKAGVAAKGLDVARKPAGVPPDANGRFTLTINGKTVVVDTRYGSGDMDDDMNGTGWARLEAGGKTLYEAQKSYYMAGAGQLKLEYTAAYVEGAKAVFVLRATESNMRMLPSTSWALTPVIDLGG